MGWRIKSYRPAWDSYRDCLKKNTCTVLQLLFQKVQTIPVCPGSFLAEMNNSAQVFIWNTLDLPKKTHTP